jgi:hypothetical protein
MFGAYGFGQGYFAQGPMLTEELEPVVSPIHVTGLDSTRPEARTQISKKARVTGLRARRPQVTDTEQH